MSQPAGNSSPPRVPNRHENVKHGLGRLFYLLHLDIGIGISEGEGAELLGGSSVRGIPEVRTVEQMPKFYLSQGSKGVPITRDWLECSLAHRTGHAELRAAEGEFRRVLLGLDTLFKGKKEQIGADRLHQFVRSLEALVLPKQGRSRNQFGHRCQTFGRGGVDKDILKEAYDMRCATEHLNRWDEAVDGYRPDQREVVLWQRTRQIEQLACDAYPRLLCNSDLREHFRTDDAIKRFWRLPDRQRCEVWGSAVDIEKELATQTE